MENLEKELAIYSGNVIKELRKQMGLTQQEFGKLIGVSNSAVANYEKGYRAPLQNTLFRIADVCNVSINTLFPDIKSTSLIEELVSTTKQLTPDRQSNVLTYAEQQLEEQNNVIPLEEHVKEDTSSIYLVGETAAGLGREYTQLNAEQINTSVPKGADYALTVRGDSMEPLISDGSIVFYKEQPSVENGEVAIVEIDGSEVTCKKFYFDNNQIVLRSINDKYDDMVLKDGVRVIGKVIL